MMSALYLAGLVAVLATVGVVTAVHAVHALLYLIVSLLAVAIVFVVLGAPFAAALEVIIYAGAIMVLFVFAVMVLSLGAQSVDQERRWLTRGSFAIPSGLASVLLAELAYLFWADQGLVAAGRTAVSAREVGAVLLGPYVIGVELASFLLLPGLIAAYHLGRRWREPT